ncbi:MAG TPA: discoidin domain-containing protein, partial [Thermoanaerobaculia bacterium]|nr:discoidin domain-containing protein [Thermoanaerobaculia bacterium]
MNRRALFALLFLAACSRPAPKQPAATTQPGKLPTDIINEQSSLLDLTRGATIVSRTGEALIITSAINTIDGEMATFWAPPPHDYPQSVVIALGSNSRIDRVGFRTLSESGYELNHLAFERSADGATWQPLATMASRHVSEAQWLDVAPVDAAYLRITILGAKNPNRDARVRSLFAHGTEIAPRRDPQLDGCWSINGEAASFAVSGARAKGVLLQGKQPLFLAGGTNGRLWRFNWIRGNDYGYAALTVSPDGKHLSALDWHEEAIPLFTAIPWFGERSPCAAPAARDDVPLTFLRRAGHVSMFALQFDASGELLAEASREELQSLAGIIRDAPPPLRVVAHEFRQSDARKNKEVAEREIASVRNALTRLGSGLERVDFVAAGSDAPRQTPASDAARAIYSSV